MMPPRLLVIDAIFLSVRGRAQRGGTHGRRIFEATVTVSRETLYQQAWEKPMSRLAAHYGISGNGLAKICDRLNIPYPPRGYWAKKAAGHKVVQYRLPALKDDTPNEVTITPTPPPPPPVQLPPEFAEQLSAARERIKDVTVRERLSSRPHAIIAGWIAEQRRRREDARLDPWRHRLRACRHP